MGIFLILWGQNFCKGGLRQLFSDESPISKNGGEAERVFCVVQQSFPNFYAATVDNIMTLLQPTFSPSPVQKIVTLCPYVSYLEYDQYINIELSNFKFWNLAILDWRTLRPWPVTVMSFAIGI